ncbi:GNAT family N-acetyltransferase [Thalassotalea fusca]
MRTGAQLLLAFHQRLKQSRHRRLVLLDGSSIWQRQWLNEFISELSNDANKNWLCYGDMFTDYQQTISSNYRHHLGTENDFIIFADPSFHPDAFAALSGTLVAGGLFIWCCDSTASNDVFQTRIITQALNNQDTIRITEQLSSQELAKLLPEIEIACGHNEPKESFRYHCVNHTQEDVVEAIIRVAIGHRNRPLVLTADRGRGKSSTLANACCELIQHANKPLDIVVTAPHGAALDVFFKQLCTVLAVKVTFPYCVNINHSTVKFIPVDVLLSNAENTPSLLLVDEAAGIPVYLLEQLLNKFHRVVFSSTVHGYEGAGRGFAISFTKYLQAATPQYNTIELSQPVRWAENDPLENFVFHGFCLNAVLPELSENDAVQPCEFHAVSSEELHSNDALLNEVLALLVTAHYQTSPSDLKLLLNNANVHLFVAYQHQQLIGTVLAVAEGQAEQQEIEAVANSKRQLKNQFLPQALFKQCGLESAFEHSYLRVMRIAVHPLRQRLGIGASLLNFVEQQALNANFDVLGTSFGATAGLVAFWQKSQLLPVRLGLQKDKASGEHALLMLKGLTTQGQQFTEQAVTNFYHSLPFMLGSHFSQLAPDLVTTLYQSLASEYLPDASSRDWQMCASFASGQRQLIDCKFALNNWLPHALKECKAIDLTMLVEVIWQHKPVEVFQAEGKVTGKKQFTQQLQALVDSCLAQVTPID